MSGDRLPISVEMVAQATYVCRVGIPLPIRGSGLRPSQSPGIPCL